MAAFNCSLSAGRTLPLGRKACNNNDNENTGLHAGDVSAEEFGADPVGGDKQDVAQADLAVRLKPFPHHT